MCQDLGENVCLREDSIKESCLLAQGGSWGDWLSEDKVEVDVLHPVIPWRPHYVGAVY